jgi:hypothetical protein
MGYFAIIVTPLVQGFGRFLLLTSSFNSQNSKRQQLLLSLFYRDRQADRQINGAMQQLAVNSLSPDNGPPRWMGLSPSHTRTEALRG